MKKILIIALIAVAFAAQGCLMTGPATGNVYDVTHGPDGLLIKKQ